ncbi:MAG TPA: pyridoxal phosphate-dependent aminotransferase [Pseudonocardiaceae bacterium]|jgi:aspartate aminotransferase|nr:pyridoxal phosphate-dependent aminotransferase [Pseudonocardiaceae bacterium]
MAVRHSATLAINEQLQARRAAGEPVLHLAFGEAGLPVLPELAGVLADSVRHNDYGPVIGIPAARVAAAGYFARRGLPTDPDQIVLAPGSKALLFALLAVLGGDVVLPAPSWVSYAAQAALLGRRVIPVPIPAESGGIPDPARLPAALAAARAAGQRPSILVLTIPDNPTGTVPPLDLLREVCEIAELNNLTIVSDEIYRDLCQARADFHSPVELVPDRTVITSGLSKNLALGGYRIGFTRLPTALRGRIGADLVGVASEIWSSLAGPMQRVAAAALAEPPEVVERIAASRRLHGVVTKEVHRLFTEAGADCRPPRAAFYLYPSFAPHRATLATQDIHTDRELADHLLTQHGIGVLPGADFGDDPAALNIRVATSLLYGQTTEERLSTLHSPQPLTLPWMAEALTHLATTLTKITNN